MHFVESAYHVQLNVFRTMWICGNKLYA